MNFCSEICTYILSTTKNLIIKSRENGKGSAVSSPALGNIFRVSNHSIAWAVYGEYTYLFAMYDVRIHQHYTL